MRVSAGGSFLTDPLQEIRRGKAALSTIQRRYTWSKQDVEDFWTSIVLGWPIGTLTIWEVTDSEALYQSHVGPITTDLHGAGWFKLILDGQNRLATLAWSLHDPATPHHDAGDLSSEEIATWLSNETLVVDFDKRKIRFADPSELEPNKFVPTYVLGDSLRLWKHVREFEFDADDITWLVETCMSGLQHARVAYTEISRATPIEAAEVFRLTNKTGRPVSDEDIERAFQTALRVEEATDGSAR